jgi:peptidyl-prolyl cis-trans isomerase SurA
VSTTLFLCLCVSAFAQTPSMPVASAPAKPVVLDRVIAIINGDVLLESDVREEMRLSVLQPVSVPANQNTVERAAQRLITRTLILRQMRDQNAINYSVTDEDVRKGLDELRRQIPMCGPMHCQTEEGWQAFLKKNGLTEQEVAGRWKERLEILKFIDQRFGVSIHISRQDIENYYQKNLLPVFEKSKQEPPKLDSVAPRIREILLQQQVNSQLRDWLQSLREQGSVQILDPKYGQSTNGEDDTGGGA